MDFVVNMRIRNRYKALFWLAVCFACGILKAYLPELNELLREYESEQIRKSVLKSMSQEDIERLEEFERRRKQEIDDLLDSIGIFNSHSDSCLDVNQ